MAKPDVHSFVCHECESTDVALEMQVGKNGKVYFHVQCNRCGSFSHSLKRNQYHYAVEDWLAESRNLAAELNRRARARLEDASKGRKK